MINKKDVSPSQKFGPVDHTISLSDVLTPGSVLEPGLAVSPRAWMMSTSSWPFRSCKPISTSPARDDTRKWPRSSSRVLLPTPTPNPNSRLSPITTAWTLQSQAPWRAGLCGPGSKPGAQSMKPSGKGKEGGAQGFEHSPMGVVARVWRPTNCAGPMLPRKSLNWASEARQTPP